MPKAKGKLKVNDDLEKDEVGVRHSSRGRRMIFGASIT
jgi:hypothetical protein